MTLSQILLTLMWLIACDHKGRKWYISVIGSWCDRCKFFPAQVDQVCHPLNLHEPKVKDPFSRGFQPMQQRVSDAVTEVWEKRNPKPIFGHIKFEMSILLLGLDSVKGIEKFWLSMAYITKAHGSLRQAVQSWHDGPTMSITQGHFILLPHHVLFHS